MYAIRHTLGWTNKASTMRSRISISNFANGFSYEKDGETKTYTGCGVSRQTIMNVLKELQKYNILEPIGNANASGQTWELRFMTKGDIDFDGLKNRNSERSTKRKKQTTNARKVKAERLVEQTSDERSVEQTEVVSSTDRSGLLDLPNETHVKTHEENPTLIAPVPDAVVPEESPKPDTVPDEPKEPEPKPAILEKEVDPPKLTKAERDAWYDAVHEVFGESAGLNGKYQKLLRGEFTERSETGKLEGEWFEYQLPPDSGLTPDLLHQWGRQYKRDNPDIDILKKTIKVQSALITFLEARKKPSEPTYLAPYHKPHVVDDVVLSEEEQAKAL